MKKVLMVSGVPLGRSGLPTVILSIIRALHCNYHFDVLVLSSEKGYYDEEVCSYSGNVFKCNHFHRSGFLHKRLDILFRGSQVYRTVREVLEQHGPYDVVHCHDGYESAVVLKAAADCGVPVRIVHTHTIVGHRKQPLQMLNEYRRHKLELYATHKVGCSKEACCAFYENPENAIAIGNAFDETRFDLSKYPESPSSAPRLLHVASYSQLKNQLFSLEVLTEIRKQYPGTQLTFIGFPVDEYFALVKKATAELGLNGNVQFLPRYSDVPLQLSKSDAFILPSKKEGFGITLLEAQAMGVRCYTSTGVPPMVNCGGTTFLDLESGPLTWAQAIIADYHAFHGKRQKFDVSAFCTANIMRTYAHIYEGEPL